MIAAAALAVLSVALLFLVGREVDWAKLSAAIERLNVFAVLPLMAVLPLFGFPIVVVYLVAGARFGPIGGGVVVAAVTACHLIGTNLLVRSILRGPLERLLRRRGQHLPVVPEDEHAAVALIAGLVPGLPYWLRNYLLALGGVRLKFMLAICLPIYVARSYVSILLGDLSGDPSTRRLVILAAIELLKVAICAYAIWRLREHHRRVHGADGVTAPPSGVAP